MQSGKKSREENYCGCQSGYVPKYEEVRSGAWKFHGCFQDCEGKKCAMGAECSKNFKDKNFNCRCFYSLGEVCEGEGKDCQGKKC